MSTLIGDWNKVVSKEITPSDFANSHWEEFKKVYNTIYHQTDMSDLYISLVECITSISKRDVVPVFNYDGQIYQYYKICLRNKKLSNSMEEPPTQSLQDMLENHGKDIEYIEHKFDRIEDENDLDILLQDCSYHLSKSQLEAVILLVQGYSRNEVASMLGISPQALNNRIWQCRDIIKDICTVN